MKISLKRQDEHRAAAAALAILRGGRCCHYRLARGSGLHAATQDREHRLDVLVFNTHHNSGVALATEAASGGKPGGAKAGSQQRVCYAFRSLIGYNRQYQLHSMQHPLDARLFAPLRSYRDEAPAGPRDISIGCLRREKDTRRSILIYVGLRVKCKRGVVLAVKRNPGLAQGAQEDLVVGGRDAIGIRICLNDHDITPG